MEKLKNGAFAFKLALSDAVLAQFERYLAYLLQSNQVMNLTAITERDEIIQKHFLDSLALVKVADFTGGKRVIDIGSGAGFPGLPLKIAVPDLELTLLDGQNKRVAFLEEISHRLSLEGVRCIHGRAEEWIAAPGERESYDYAVSRAVARLCVLLELSLPYVRVGGAFLAMKTPDSDAELEEAKGAAEALGGIVESCLDYVLPETDISRRIVRIRKLSKTAEKYPRRFAKIQKKPLI